MRDGQKLLELIIPYINSIKVTAGLKTVGLFVTNKDIPNITIKAKSFP